MINISSYLAKPLIIAAALSVTLVVSGCQKEPDSNKYPIGWIICGLSA